MIISTTISRDGPAAKRNVRFRLERPDKTRPAVRDRQVLLPDQFIERVKTVDIPGNGAEPIQFKFSEPLEYGIHHGFVEVVGEDSLSFDDERYFTIEVRDAWDILVVTGDNVKPDNLTEAIVDETGNSLYNCTVVNQNELPGNFDSYQAVILLDPNPGIPN